MRENVVCPHVNCAESAQSLRCAVLKEQQKKWDFCIHQFFCRTHGRYKIAQGSESCNLRKTGKED